MKSIAVTANVQMIAVDLAKEVFQLACADATTALCNHCGSNGRTS
jgi:hypothetical protein